LQKNKLILMNVLAALLVCSAFSVVAAEEDYATATPDGSAPSEPTVDPNATINPDDSRSLDEPVGYGDDILYTIQDDNSTDTNTTGQEPMPYGDEIYANGLADEKASGDNTTLIVTAAGVVAAVAVGGALGFVYYRKTKA
jgi:hypothetical protein